MGARQYTLNLVKTYDYNSSPVHGIEYCFYTYASYEKY